LAILESDKDGWPLQTTVRQRKFALAGCGNFRDLGGYETNDGRRVRWRTLFRSDSLSWLTSEDIATLAAQQVGLVVGLDLRTAEELNQTGHGLIYENGTLHHHLPFFPSFGEDREQMRAMAFATGAVGGDWWVNLLDVACPCFARLFELLADPVSYPAAIYCAAGKDRTGVVSALLLSSLGVSDEQIVADYALTEAPDMERILRRLRALGREWAEDFEPSQMAAHPETMQHFLSAFQDRYGSAEDYLLASGVAAGAIEQVRLNLLEG
jgi:protein-tyrosine phosphatase